MPQRIGPALSVHVQGCVQGAAMGRTYWRPVHAVAGPQKLTAILTAAATPAALLRPRAGAQTGLPAALASRGTLAWTTTATAAAAAGSTR